MASRHGRRFGRTRNRRSQRVLEPVVYGSRAAMDCPRWSRLGCLVAIVSRRGRTPLLRRAKGGDCELIVSVDIEPIKRASHPAPTSKNPETSASVRLKTEDSHLANLLIVNDIEIRLSTRSIPNCVGWPRGVEAGNALKTENESTRSHPAQAFDAVAAHQRPAAKIAGQRTP
jgi:hypothetical protein